MQVEEFNAAIMDYFAQSGTALIQPIPAGSGILHIANVPIANWSPGYVSTAEGRWNFAGSPVKYFADNFNVCMAELGYTEQSPPTDRTFEVWQTKRETLAINIDRLPEELKGALYEDRGLPPIKWAKTHALLGAVGNSSDLAEIQCIYAPSASGLALGIGGMCFVANPQGDRVERLGVYSFADFQSGKLSNG